MNIIDAIAEARILEAQQRGEFDHLPGAGRPLQWDDDSLIPEELRAAYRLLKNAGCLPPELELRREIRDAEQLLRQAEYGDAGEYRRALARLEWLRLQLAESSRISPALLEEGYRQKLLERLSR
ncbi:MAG TPA: DnaJ family domain-containing protein [Candidatus Competibacteraceae bacterium]|nr:DnaJ family domain-containing protein [Candidatus Competibacteraceae bacterium]